MDQNAILAYNYNTMRLLLFLNLSWFLLSSISAHARTYYVTQYGGQTIYKGRSIRAEAFSAGIKKARAGDRVVVLPGTYRKSYEISKRVDPKNPVIISGSTGLTSFACSDLPENQGDSILKISVSKGLVFENFRFENCWPSPVFITDSSHISFRNNIIRGGTNAFRIAQQSSFAIEMTNNQWQQDNTRSKLWESNPNKISANSDISEYKGAFLLIENVLGNIIVRENKIEHSFGLLDCKPHKTKKLTTSNISIINNEADHIRGSLIANSCALNNLYFANNRVASFGTFLDNQKSISKAIVLNNDFKNHENIHGQEFLVGIENFSKGQFVHNSVDSGEKNLKQKINNKALTRRNNLFDISPSKPSKNRRSTIYQQSFAGYNGFGDDVDIPIQDWGSLPDNDYTYIVSYSATPEQIEFGFSRAIKSFKKFRPSIRVGDGKDRVDLKCRMKNKLSVTCQLKDPLRELGINGDWAGAVRLHTWPYGDMVTILDPPEEEGGLLDFGL